ncbi:hypothetical protein [Streptomyces sp. NPDC046161]|uniref:hypothetical protein n=1 Tax=Streptomyces sp. NPDC046161 TaxID=3155132 RepID=UPI00340A8F9B
MTGWPSEGLRRLAPEAEAEQIRQLAADRATNALRHKVGCPCDACRIQRQAYKRRLAKVVAA